MMTMNALDIPAGFEPLWLGAGFSEHFGPVYMDRARLRLGLRLAAQHMNPVGACHGGALATFADMQIAVLNRASGSSAGHAPTVHLALDYVRTAPQGSWVAAHVTMLQRTRRLVFTQALIVADDVLMARSNAIYRYYGDAASAAGRADEDRDE
jgi:uncharacterized protein (TIGR00369 family)